MRLKEWLVIDCMNEVLSEALKVVAAMDPARKDQNLAKILANYRRVFPNRASMSPGEIIGSIRHNMTNYDAELKALDYKTVHTALCDRLKQRNLFFQDTFNLINKFVQAYLDNPQQYVAANNVWLKSHFVNDQRCYQQNQEEDDDPRLWRSGWRKTA